MTKVHYEVVPHDGGWTYKVGDVFAETFRSREAAVSAAKRAAVEQRSSGDPGEIEYEDEKGVWHEEHSEGEPPETDVT